MALNTAILGVGKVIGWLALLLMVFVMLLQVVCRYVFDNALPWPDEAARFLMLWRHAASRIAARLERYFKSRLIVLRDVCVDYRDPTRLETHHGLWR